MPIRSLAYRTDLMMLALEGELRLRPGYRVARLPDQPGFYWGNLLLFEGPPGPGDAQRWPALFREEFADLPAVRHMTFGWDDPQGAPGHCQPFLAAGFELERSVVLVSDGPRPPPHPRPDLEVRPLASDADWEAAVACQVACRDPRHAAGPYRAFKQARMASMRGLVAAGHGVWYGAFQAGTLVGDLGIFHQHEVGRYQTVGTLPAHRRQGVCGTLVHQAAVHARAHLGVTTLVMVADPEDHAVRVYRSVGFQDRERQIGLTRWQAPP